MQPIQRLVPNVTPISTEMPCRRCGRAVVVQATRGALTGQTAFPATVTCAPCEEELDAAIRAEDAARQQALAVARRTKLVADLDVPVDFAWATRVEDIRANWGSPAQRARITAALGVARQIVLELTSGLRPPLFVVFSGRPGNGKSLLAWTIAHELAGVHGRSARVVRLSTMVRDIRETWGRGGKGPTEASRLYRYTSPDFLAVDEVSRAACYGKPGQHLLDVVNERVERHRPTVITSNDDLAELEAFLGPQLMSRLAMGGRVDFGSDEDRRQIVAQEGRNANTRSRDARAG